MVQYGWWIDRDGGSFQERFTTRRPGRERQTNRYGYGVLSCSRPVRSVQYSTIRNSTHGGKRELPAATESDRPHEVADRAAERRPGIGMRGGRVQCPDGGEGGREKKQRGRRGTV